MRSDARPNDVIRAVVNMIEATFDRSRWMEIGLLTDTLDYIQGHRRLLRSLDWGDPDYGACVIDPSTTGTARKAENLTFQCPAKVQESGRCRGLPEASDLAA